MAKREEVKVSLLRRDAALVFIVLASTLNDYQRTANETSNDKLRRVLRRDVYRIKSVRKAMWDALYKSKPGGDK